MLHVDDTHPDTLAQTFHLRPVTLQASGQQLLQGQSVNVVVSVTEGLHLYGQSSTHQVFGLWFHELLYPVAAGIAAANSKLRHTA